MPFGRYSPGEIRKGKRGWIYKPRKRPVKRATGTVTRVVPNARINKHLGIPLVARTNLRYAQTFVVDQAAPYQQQFRLNSLFDPDFTGGGHQPLQYDQYGAWYNHYLVTDCTTTIMITQTNSKDFPVVLTYAVKTNSTITANSIDESLEQGNRSVMQLGYAGSGSSSKTLVRPASVAKYHGVRSIKTSDDHFTGLVGANPADSLVGTVQVYRGDDTTGTISFVMTVILDYKCQFFGQKDIAQS